MATSDDVTKALVACAQAELNRPLKENEVVELVNRFNSYKNLDSTIRIKRTLTEFSEGKSRFITDSVSASDNVSRKIIDLENALKDWNK